MANDPISRAPAGILLDADKRVRKALLPYRETPPVKAIDWASQAGDQLQLRLISGAVIAIGLLRRDARMAGAGVRMLVAHELATLAKDWTKERVVRTRPRSATKRKGTRPRKGHDTRKEESSFPSGHAAGATAAAQAFAAVYPEHAGAARMAAGAVSLGRLPGCAHYPSDLAAGAAIGVTSAGIVGAGWALSKAILARLYRSRQPR